MSGFKKAARTARKIKASIQGASGSGKTFSALKIATALVNRTDPGKGIALIDTEKSAALYAPPFVFDIDDDFGEGPKLAYTVDKLIEKLENARKAGDYGAVIVDSATHFWKEQGGLLSMIDSICAAQRAKGQKGDSFAAWKSVDPIYRKLMTYLRSYPLHVFLCIRCKQTYEKVEGANGKGSVKKVGVEPEFREGFEFEMDAQFAVDENHVMVPLKHRLGDALDGKTFRNPGDDVAEVIAEWLALGTAAPEPAPEPTAAPATAEPQPSNPAALEELLKVIDETTDIEKLRGDVRVLIKKAVDDKRITAEEYAGVSEKWAAKGKALKAASEAA